MFGTERVPPALSGGQHSVASRTARNSRDRTGRCCLLGNAMGCSGLQQASYHSRIGPPCGAASTQVLCTVHCTWCTMYVAAGCSDGLDASAASRVTHLSNRAGPWPFIGDAAISRPPPLSPCPPPLLSRYWFCCRRGAWQNMCHACWPAALRALAPLSRKVPTSDQGPDGRTRACQCGSASCP